MYTFAFIVCSMMALFGVLAIGATKLVEYWIEKKGVEFYDEY